MNVREIDLGGRRRLRVGSYEHGDETVAFLALAWDGAPLWPLPAQTIALPVSILPDLRAALDTLAGESER